MAPVRQIRICGLGGQGVVLAGTLLGQAAVLEGKWVAGSSSYGAQARGGYAKSDVIIADTPIVYPHLLVADVLGVMSQSAYERYRSEVAAEGLILYEEQLVQPAAAPARRHVGVPATRCALESLGDGQAANMVLLGALLAFTRVVDQATLARALEAHLAPALAAASLRALEAGMALGGLP